MSSKNSNSQGNGSQGNAKTKSNRSNTNQGSTTNTNQVPSTNTNNFGSTTATAAVTQHNHFRSSNSMHSFNTYNTNNSVGGGNGNCSLPSMYALSWFGCLQTLLVTDSEYLLPAGREYGKTKSVFKWGRKTVKETVT